MLLFTFNTFQAFFLFTTFLVHTKYIQPRVCTRFTKGMYLIHGQILEKPYKSRTFGFSPLPFAKVEVLTCDLYSNFHDKICFASTHYSFEWYRLISSRSGNNCPNVLLFIPCSLLYKNGDCSSRGFLGNAVTVHFFAIAKLTNYIFPLLTRFQ